MDGIGPNKREAAAAVRRAQLLEVALELFAEVGIERATIKMLAARVGMSAGLLYHYFRSKEELVQAVLDNHSFDEETQRIYQQVETLAVEEALSHILWETLQLHWRHKEALWILFREMHANPQIGVPMKRSWSENLELLRGFLDERMQRGELARHEPRVVAHWLFSSVYLIHLIYGRDLEFTTLPDDPESVRAYVGLQVEILLNGLKPQTIECLPEEVSDPGA